MELSRLVVVQHHGHLTLTLDFQGQILKMLYLRNGMADWHGTKGMWVGRMLHPLCDFQLWPQPRPWPWIFQEQILKKVYLRNGMADWHGMKGMWVDRMLNLCCDFQRSPHPRLWPWIFKVKFLKCCISGMGGLIDIERKGYESIWCYIHFVTFNFDLNHDLDLGFSRSNFEKVVSGMGWPIDMEWKGCESIECWTHVLTFNVPRTHDLDLGFSRSNFEKVVSYKWDGWLTWNERDVSR